MKDLSKYVFEKEKVNKSDEDYLVTMLSWRLEGGGDLKMEDDQIIVTVKKEYKKEILDLCKRQNYKVIKAGAEGKGWSKIFIKRDPAKQKEEYNLDENYMKDIKVYLAEAKKKATPKKEYPYKKAETYGKLGEKWFDKCRNFATAGSTSYTKYGINDFKGFLEDMDKEFEPPKDGKTCQIRWEMCQALKDKDLDKFVKIAKDNNIDKFTYGSFMSENVYGSYFLDTYMLLRTYEYVLDGNMIIRNGILNAIWQMDDTMDAWYKNFIEEIHKLEKQVPGHK